MIEFAGLIAYGCTVWMALTYHDYLRHRSRCAAYRARAERLRHMQGTP